MAIVSGVRTPFALAGTRLAGLSAAQLGRLATTELVQRTSLVPARIEQVVFGRAALDPASPNVAHEIAAATGLLPAASVHTVTCSCASGYQAILHVADAILAGRIECGLAGASESATSADGPSRAVRDEEGPRPSRGGGRLGRRSSPPHAESRQRPSPEEGAERLARTHGITRSDQDRFAHRSHQLAARACREARFEQDVMPVYVPPSFAPVTHDQSIRSDSSLSDYSRFVPWMGGRQGSVTPGNSAAPADGAGAVVLMQEGRARREGVPVLGYVRAAGVVALGPDEHPLLAPAYALPRALRQADLRFRDLDVVDLHEAFAAGVLACVSMLESDVFARQHLGRSKRLVGAMDWDRCNASGGSIAFGHAGAATGIRQVLQTLRELRRREGRYGLVATSTPDGLGSALVLEAP